MSSAVIAIALLVLAVVVLITDWIPMAIVGIAVPVILGFVGILKPEEAFYKFGDPTLVLIAGVFVISKAFFEVGLAAKIGNAVSKFGKNHDGEKPIVFLCLISSILMSTVLPNMGVAAALLPCGLAIAQYTGVSRSKVLMVIAMGSSLGGMLTLLGTPPNMLANGYLKTAGVEQFGFFDFAYGGLPIVILCVIYLMTIGYKLLPDNVKEHRNDHSNEEEKVYDKKQQVYTLTAFIVLILGVIFEKVTGIQMHMVSVICAVSLVLLKVIDVKKAFAAIDWGTMVFVSGMLTLADALQKTGASKLIAESILGMVGDGLGKYVLVALMFGIAIIMTQFLNNTGTAGILIPIGLSFASSANVDPQLVTMAITLGVSCVFAAPIGTPANIFVAGPGELKFTDWVKVGTPMVIICFIAAVVFLPLIF
ncbi:SLC13 family permease [Bacillus rubiinfantis]|uniref:SLC13 family permease n=1 Tax=Bacillus rubiinfantis TaxID=1499680 RepID=UPI0005A85BD5|nr:SLC13 family permease [Bacillus rubiinfantis]